MSKTRFYIILLVVLLMISSLALVWILNSYSPESTTVIILFYSFLGIVGFSLITMLGYYLRRMVGQREFQGSYAAAASRQGAWLSLILVISFILLHQGWFTWLNAVFMVLAFVSLEMFILLHESR